MDSNEELQQTIRGINNRIVIMKTDIVFFPKSSLEFSLNIWKIFHTYSEIFLG